MQYQTFVFDFDLTLADASPAIFACSHYALGRLGFADVDDATIFSTIGQPLGKMFTIFTGSDDRAKQEEFVRIYRQKAEEIMDGQTVLLPGAKELITWLYKQGKTCAIVSTKIRARILSTLQRNGLQSMFSLVVAGEDVSVPKPDPQGLMLVAKTLGTPKESILYVGDNQIDARTAQNFGVDFAAVLSGPTPKEAFEALPHRYICQGLTQLHAILKQDAAR